MSILQERLLAIDPEWYEAHMARAVSVPAPAAAIDVGMGMSVPDVLRSVSGDAAVLDIKGPLTADAPHPIDVYYGNFGTAYPHIIDAIRNADEQLTARIGATGGKLIVNIDSPGGAVRGVDGVHSAFADVAKRRYVQMINRGMMTSAAAWIASAGTEIVSDGESAMFGSIGVIVNTFDWSAYMEKHGVKRVTVTNTMGSKKAANIATDEGQAILRSQLDEIYAVFRDRVSARGRISPEDVDELEGSAILTRRALAIGLADRLLSNQPPAVEAGQKQETHMASLKEILASDPAVAAEVEALKQAAYAAGAEKEKAEHTARLTAAKPYLANATYGQKVSEVAAKVVSGEVSIDALTTVVAVLDASKEAVASEAAKKKTEEIGSTASDNPANNPAQTFAAENAAILAAL